MSQNIVERNSTDLVREYYKDYSKYVLETRALPSTMDGLKLVQRRILYTASKMPQKLTKTALMAGNVMHYHPHGSSSGAIYTMASPLNNVKIFNTKGNFGSVSSPAAADRYTECYLNDIGRYIYCQFLDYAEYEEGELGLMEPKYLPSLLPYAFLEGSSGIGVGLSTNIMPINVMELIDYYIGRIKYGASGDRCYPTPDLGSIILDMEDDEKDDAVRNNTGTLVFRSAISRESATTFVVEDLYGKSIDSVVKKLSWCIDNGQVDFRDESSVRARYVFEIIDKKMDPEYFYKYLEKYCSKRETFNRWMVDKDKSAVMTNFDYVINSTLEGLNKAIDKMISQKLIDAKHRLKLLISINQLRNSGHLNKITKMTQEEFIAWMPLICMEADEEIAREVFKKPISYLTRAHEQEMANLEEEIKKYENHNRVDYLVGLYETLKSMIQDDYNSKKHSVMKSKLLTNPKIHLIDGHTVEIYQDRRKGIRFSNYVYLISKSGVVYKRSFSSQVRNIIALDMDDPIIAIVSDQSEYIELITVLNRQYRYISIKASDIKYDKEWINFYDGELMYDAVGWYGGANILPNAITESAKKISRTKVRQHA